MMYTLLVGLIFLSFFIGYYLREVLNTLRKVINHLDGLRNPQGEDKKPETNFAEPMTRTEMAAMLEEEKINLLNK